VVDLAHDVGGRALAARKHRGRHADERYQGEVDRLFDAVRNDEKYLPERYEAALAGIRNAVAR
jgi:hypothetical protein